MSAAGGGEEARRCVLLDCVCCWRRGCSPRIPRVAPGKDYVCICAGADDRPAWSLLVGFLSSSYSTISGSVLGLHEFRVARSGRVLGGSSGDALEVRHRVETKGGVGIVRATQASRNNFPVRATAALTPDGRSICLFSEYLEEGEPSYFPATPTPQRLDLTRNPITVSAMPRLPLDPSMRRMLCRPVSAAGRVWAPYVRHDSCSLAMHRLDDAGGRWEQVGGVFHFPHDEKEVPAWWSGSLFFQGYAVLHDDTILVSLLRPSYSYHGFFLTFNCSDGGTWSEVAAPEHAETILGRGVHVEEDASVYFLRGSRIFAYKLRYDDQDQPRRLRLEAPAVIDSVCPFDQQGYAHGLLAHLGGRLMCSVWINTENQFRCSCDHLHVLITTFELRSQHKGIDVLHSTCRRLDVSPGSFNHHEFFLQEYEDDNAVPPSTLPLLLDDDPTCSNVDTESSKMLDCCRKFLSEKPSRVYEFEEPRVDINAELYLFCEAGSKSIVYVAKIENGRCHDKVLTQKHTLIASEKHCNRSRLFPWHLVFSSSSSNSSIYAVSRAAEDRHGVHVYRLREESPQHVPPDTRPASDPFSIVLQVGGEIVAVTDDLHVFYRHQSRSTWVACRHQADDSLTLYNEEEEEEEEEEEDCKRGGLVLKEKSELSGYAVLGKNSFVVSDANSGSMLVYDLGDEYWSVLGVASSPGKELLNGRSVMVDGFIYTCTSGGIAAHELVTWHDDQEEDGDPKQHGVLLLRDPILLPFSWELTWRKSWVADRMCLDCVSADRDTIVFCVVQGEYCSFRRGSNDVHITTVEVKTRTPPPGQGGGRREPERIEHVAIGTCFVEHDAGFVWTKTCFALGT